MTDLYSSKIKNFNSICFSANTEQHRDVSRLSPFTLVIPEYQRIYEWSPTGKKPDVKIFWNDLVKETDDSGRLFAGCVLTGNQMNEQSTYIKHSWEGVARETYLREIIDGQQRVTTTLILLAAFRDSILDRTKSFSDVSTRLQAEAFAQNIQKQYFQWDTGRVLPTGKAELAGFRFIARKTLRKYFERNVLRYPFDGNWDTPGVSGQEWNGAHSDYEDEKINAEEWKNIQKTYKWFRGKFNDNDDYSLQGPEKISESLNKLAERLDAIDFVHIQLYDTEKKYKIFESLNAKGRGLSSDEQIKSYLIKTVSEINKRKIYSKWEQLQSNVNNTPKFRIDKVIFTHLKVRHKKVSTASMLTSVREQYKTQADVIALANDLASSSRLLSMITNAGEEENLERYLTEGAEDERDFTKAIFALKLFRKCNPAVVQPYIFLLSLFQCLRERSVSPKEAVIAIDLINKFSYAFLGLAKGQGKEIGPAYIKCAQDLYGNTKNYDARTTRINKNKKSLSILKKSHREIWPKPESIEEGLKKLKYIKGRMANNQKVLGALIFLEEASCSRAATFRTLSFRKLTVEHITPREPADDDSLWQEMDKHNHESIMNARKENRLGNLTVLEREENQRVGNDPPRIKMDDVIYRESKWAINQKVREAFYEKDENWDLACVSERQNTVITKLSIALGKTFD